MNVDVIPLKTRLKFTLKHLLTAIAFVALIAALYSAYLQINRTAELANSCLLARFIVMELEANAVAHDGLLTPAIETAEDGTEMHSWRFVSCRMLFGDMVQVGFYGQAPDSAYNHPWNHPRNKRYYDGPHRDYGGSPNSFIDAPHGDHSTRYSAITGPGTAFDDSGTTVFYSDLDDDTILFVETRNSVHHWMKPGGDFDVTSMPSSIGLPNGISGRDSRGFIVAFADKQVWVLSHDTPLSDLAKFFTIANSKKHNRAEGLEHYRVR